MLEKETQLSRAFEELKVNPQDEAAIRAFLEPLKQKDPDTYEHGARVGLLARRIGEFIGIDGKPLFFAGLLHDLGKLNISSKTLGKTDKWTDEDSWTIEPHVISGYMAIKGRFDFTAEVILLHHSFQKDRYPKDLPPYLHNYSLRTKVLIFRCARVLALADVYDALHREDNKFGEKRSLSGTEIKVKMLELNPDRKSLIEDLYKAGIFLQ